MKLREVIDVMVVPNSFRNIDFSHKGIYTLSFRVHSKVLKSEKSESPEIVCAYPMLMNHKTVIPGYQLSASYTISETSEYRTKSFYISFNDESVHFDSGCLFRIELDCEKQSHTQLFLECFLLHYQVPQSDPLRVEAIQPKDFALRGVRMLKLNTRQRDLQHHGEVVFNSMDFFSIIDLSVMITRLDYRLRLHNYQLSQYCLMDEENKRKNSNTQQLFKLLPYQELLSCTQKGMGFMELRQTFQNLVTGQLDNYDRLLGRLKDFINGLTETELIEFKEQNKKTPPCLKSLRMSLAENDKFMLSSLKTRYETDNNAQMRLLILKESNDIAKSIRFVWNMITSLCLALFKRQFHDLRLEEAKKQRQQIHSNYFRKLSCDRTKQINKFKLDAGKIEGIIPVGYKYPLFFGDEVEYKPKIQGEVLTVFVHGFQGSEFDLELVKNYIQAYYRECTCLMINSLEDETSGNIETLGEKFAQEVERFIQRSAFEYKRINFVGYSLGGVIIRAGMRHLAAYKDKVNLLITLASPHLGIHRMDNFLVSAGVWYMIKFDKVRSLNELNYTDDDNVLLKLSKDESLGWFNKIIVASSKEDNFVPNYSARIEPHDKDPLAQQAYNNISKIVKEIVRLDVWFDSEGGALDRMLGRKSHIDFLESEGFSEIFFKLFGNLL